MSKTNCINCGVAKEVSDLQCPFCGTKYADLTTFDLFHDEREFYVQLRGSDGTVKTAKAYIRNKQLNFHPEYLDIRNVDGTLPRRIMTAMNVEGSIDFALYESL